MRTVRDQPRTTGDLLREEMASRNLSVRGLARLVADTDDHEEVERCRRNLNRYLAGGDPKPEQAAVMERRLGKPEGFFPRYEPARRPRVVEGGPVEYLAAPVIDQVREGVLATLGLNADSMTSLEEDLQLLRGEVRRVEQRVSRLESRRRVEGQGHA